MISVSGGVAIALGKLVLVDCGFGLVERLRLKLALGRAHDMWFTQGFASRHRELAKITSAISEGDGSKWRVRPALPPRGASNRDAHEINSHASFVLLLQCMMVRG